MAPVADAAAAACSFSRWMFSSAPSAGPCSNKLRRDLPLRVAMPVRIVGRQQVLVVLVIEMTIAIRRRIIVLVAARSFHPLLKSALWRIPPTQEADDHRLTGFHNDVQQDHC